MFKLLVVVVVIGGGAAVERTPRRTAARAVGKEGFEEEEAKKKKKKSVGCLIVGLGGNNGVTVVAGLVANRRKVEWEGSKRKCEADWTGCVTQQASRREAYELCAFEDAKIGGWDVRETRLGDALVEARILDPTLASEVRDEMNTMGVWPGVWDPEYIGETQHATATRTIEGSIPEKLERVRRDIRGFREGVDGHTTVVWSASVEAPSALDPELVSTADRLLETLSDSRIERVPPSLVYAAAAALEGCSFVNGGSQDTICPGLEELFARHGGYCLGTDFKAGQTKFKSAAVEYLQALALRVKVVASSNHLGNNDMKSLLGRPQRDAKLRVKSDIFPPDSTIESHVVSVMYAPYVGDEKRDFVEYTSEAFLSQLHTMVTYTRCSDSVLCAPLIIDACVWCDAFRRRRVPRSEVEKALAYLFKVSSSSSSENSYYFFAQMRDLEEACRQHLRRRRATTTAGEPPLVACAGLACLDLELGRASTPSSLESIATFRGTTEKPGGSAPQVATALAGLGQRCVVVSNLGDDAPGARLRSLLAEIGVECLGRGGSTGVAVVPVFEAGGRGCYFDPGANADFGPEDVAAALKDLEDDDVAALHVGYPHLLPSLCGDALADVLVDSAAKSLLTSLDLNGIQPHHRLGDAVLPKRATAAVDVLHANRREAATLLGQTDANLSDLARDLARQSGAALVSVTDGANGAVLVVADADRLGASSIPLAWASSEARVPAYSPAGATTVNANGAGDAFVAGLITGALRAKSDDATSFSLDHVGKLAALAAYLRVVRAPPMHLSDIVDALDAADAGNRSILLDDESAHSSFVLPPELPIAERPPPRQDAPPGLP
ncbi:hypothetical protein CTAYLR_001813 [Chrysophaeum taylorii]|uniref:inositol-3-phosphate synthase n=1 Tax=Chrysophaeum taylorii TaxID=2483200 RepID=A0AAD7U820_9STRA|nr:hypothetical protein CTAYLR_001813 [Chrysophaeum taylorii]